MSESVLGCMCRLDEAADEEEEEDDEDEGDDMDGE